jgi:hypothetical protein
MSNDKYKGGQAGRSAVRIGIGAMVAGVALYYLEVPEAIEEYVRGLIIWGSNESAYIFKLVVKKYLPGA